MQAFEYQKIKTPAQALQKTPGKRKFLAGGTSLIDLMKLEVETPEILTDLNLLPLDKIEQQDSGEWKIGAVVKNSDLAYDQNIRKYYKVLSDAILSGASAQLRNKATTAGNLLQRTRCVYFRDTSKACNKREPGSGCAAIEGFNRNLAILGTSSECIATNPSDMNVAMMALEAKILLQSSEGERTVEIKDFYLLPQKTPQKETVLKAEELITAVTLPVLPKGSTSLYLKLRDRASYEFALASIALILSMDGERIGKVRFAMGGIGTKPWRVESAEKLLEGSLPSEDLFQKCADEFLKGAKPQSENAFKLELARRCLVKGLKMATSKVA
jgi:xanthine dehydrogenase YagS FAD-binding subunit